MSDKPKPITDLERIMSLTLQGVNSSAYKRDIIDFTVTENSGETTVIATQFVGLENAFGKQLKFEEKYQNESHESIQNSLEKMKKEMGDIKSSSTILKLIKTARPTNVHK